MGLGKTVITLTAIEELVCNRFEVSKVLVIAPLRVAEAVWSAERDRWVHLHRLRVSKAVGGRRERLRALQQKADIYTINRENVPWLVELFGSRWPFDMVVIDESSSFKNPQAARFKALRKVLPKIKRLVELTGTPSPNGLMDLWSQIYLLDKGARLGCTLGEYRRRWFTPGAGCGHVVYEWRPRPEAAKEIRMKISDICVSMRTEDYLDLPEAIYNRVEINLPENIIAEYKQLERDLILPLKEADIEASTAASLSNKLLQMASGAVYLDDGSYQEIHEKKLEALSELAESNEYKSILVFYWYRHDLERLQKRFPQARKLDRAKDITDWNNGRIRMLLVHPASAGHGLNLQYGGNVIVWFSLSWSLELYQQANKRLHRSGQQSAVIIHHLIAKGTIDEAVIKALAEKKAGQDGLLEALKAKILRYRNGKT